MLNPSVMGFTYQSGSNAFRLFPLLLREERPEAGQGSAPAGDCSQASDGDGLSDRRLPLQRAPSAALQWDSLCEFPALKSDRGGLWVNLYVRKWDMYVSSMEYAISKTGTRCPCN